jgi:hypothetical protein
MPKKVLPSPERSGAAHDPIGFVIHPTAAYLDPDLRAGLRLPLSTLKRETAKRRLRYSKRAGVRYYLGEWVLEWLRAGEVRRDKVPTEPGR